MVHLTITCQRRTYQGPVELTTREVHGGTRGENTARDVNSLNQQGCGLREVEEHADTGNAIERNPEVLHSVVGTVDVDQHGGPGGRGDNKLVSICQGRA